MAASCGGSDTVRTIALCALLCAAGLGIAAASEQRHHQELELTWLADNTGSSDAQSADMSLGTPDPMAALSNARDLLSRALGALQSGDIGETARLASDAEDDLWQARSARASPALQRGIDEVETGIQRLREQAVIRSGGGHSATPSEAARDPLSAPFARRLGPAQPFANHRQVMADATPAASNTAPHA
jgi:hypothetical protein